MHAAGTGATTIRAAPAPPGFRLDRGMGNAGRERDGRRRPALARFAPPGLSGARGHLPGDALAGLSLAAIAVPGSMGAAQLVGAPANAGLLAFVVGVVVFALFGGHRTLSVGADSSIAPMLAAAAAGGAITGTATRGETTPDGAPIIDGATLMLVSMLVGAILIAVGVARAGWITQFLSRPVTTGLLAGIGLGIIVDQLPVALGIPRHGTGGTVSDAVRLVRGIGDANPWAIAVTAAVLGITLGARLIGPRAPGALAGLAVAMAMTAAMGLADRGVVTLPDPSLIPPLPDYGSVTPAAAVELLPTALVISALCIIQTGATETLFPGRGRTLDRDLGAIGAASAVAAVTGGFAVNTSPARTSVVAAAGGKTQVTGLVAAALVVALAAPGGRLLPLLPTAALAAVLFTVAARLIDVRTIARIARFSRIEFAVCVATIVLVAFAGVVEGVVIAAVVTLLDRTRREARPPVYRKGMIPKSNHWVPVDAGVETVQVPGVLVWSVDAPLWYADADHVVERLDAEIAAGDERYAAVVLDAAGIADLDYTGARALSAIVDHMGDAGIPFIVARPNRQVQKSIGRLGLGDRLPTAPTVAAAVKTAASDAGLSDELRAARGKGKDIEALKSRGLTPEETLGRALKDLERDGRDD